jgi:peptidylprolyl isomerase
MNTVIDQSVACWITFIAFSCATTFGLVQVAHQVRAQAENLVLSDSYSYSPSTTMPPKSSTSSSSAAPVQKSPEANPVAVLTTSFGAIELELNSKIAPNAVANFVKLAESGFYDGTKFHRVIKGFMIQGGDPLSKGADRTMWGKGGPGYQFADEVADAPLIVRGTLAMANSGPNTNGSQFFIVTAAATPWLDGGYTVFGKVISGMDVVDKIESVPVNHPDGDKPVEDVVVSKVVVK